MDCFYAQVEMRDNPKLRSVPLGIGGPPKSRSVLCTSNYLARKFGVKSAMPVDYALKLCPSLVIVAPNFKKYKEASEIIFDIYQEYTDKIETLSLDEAYLEIPSHLNATELAKEIKNKIFLKTGLTSSAGVSYNKFLAKMASDWNKPDGLFVIPPEKGRPFLTDLEVKKLPGVGPKTSEFLKLHGIQFIKDIRSIDEEKLVQLIGSFGHELKKYAEGIDHREIINDYIPKSISVEETFLKDLELQEEWHEEINKITHTLKSRLEKNEGQYFYKLIIKIKTTDFKRHSIEKVLPLELFEIFNHAPDFNHPELQILMHDLIDSLYQRVRAPIRLIGLGVKLVGNNPYHKIPNQLQLPFPHISDKIYLCKTGS